ncbi:glycosyl hydrolase family 8 [Cytophaga aurantiaca]|uniref:glycosyl hydrolase family 8 n=1 Tax=Cytophaga aurantiaca TaxID=29530 RepID=UPI00035CFE20|nr:glycosyl hydrolase family 8 [Cytophaga aurantiaca]
MRIVTFISFLFATLTVFGQINSGSPAIPFGSKISTVANPYGNGILPTNLPTGTYDLSTNQFGKSQDAADAYNTWKTNYVVACGSNFRVKFDTPTQTVSEGIGYGMLIAAYAGDKTLFDGLWGYYKANSNGNGLMNWRTGACTADQSGGATDADLDAAMALLIAKCQWPSATSPYNYANEATTLITAIKNTEIHNTNYQAINGDGWGFGSSCRNPGYQSPAYYREFAVHIASQATFWNTNVVPAAYALLNANRNTTTGLISNWSDVSGAPNSCNGSNEYGYDACRNPWRMATDVLWNGNATAQTNFCIPIAAYVNGKGANASGPVPQAGGTTTTNEATFSSMYAAGICGSNATYQTIMNSMYTKTVATTDALPRYFGNTLRVISLFIQTGNFWKPCNAAPATVSVSLTAPTTGQTFNEGDAITLTATASTTNGTISKVEFYNGSVLIGTATSSPYTISWTTAPAGTNQIVAKAYNTASETAATSSIPVLVIKSVYQTSTAPVMDGTAEAIWGGSNTSASLNSLIGGTISGSSDLSANYKAMWDATYFYLLVNVTDDVKTNNAGTDYYNDDAVEVFFDIGNNKASTYGTNDFQYTFRWNDNTIYEKNSKITGVSFAKVDNATGYVMEMRFPWSTLTGSPAVNQLVGFDVAVNDDDDGGARDGKISWAQSADQAWTNPSYMGTVILKGIACTLPSAAGAITGTTTTCAGTAGVTYSITTVSGATGYTWAVPTGASITAGTNTNSITVTFGTAGGSVTVTPTNTCGNGTSSSSTITVGASVTPSVAAAADATTICAGTTVTFTATPTNGGTPSYQWRKNTVAISGATTATYATSAISNGDVFDVVMTSTANCRSANTANSNQVTMTVTASVTPIVIASTGATTVCTGTSVTFTAAPTNGGTPSYQWRKNSTAIGGATSATYSTTAISNGDVFDVVMTSTANCRSANTATSNPVTMTVTASVTPSVAVAADATTICAGTTVTFTATPTNGGTPSYQWRKNTVAISGATSATYSTTAISNGDVFDVVMTSTANCRSANTANSNQITMTVTASVTPSVIASTSTTTICTGMSVTFTAAPTNGGTPSYQWRKNSTAIGGATSATYSTTVISNGDVFDVVMTSTANCRSANTATSNPVTMTVTASVTPNVAAAADATTICTGTAVTFTATPTNGGTPSYQWRKNTVAISGATSATYATSVISNGDVFDVVMTSTANCRSANTANSNQVTITITTSVTPSVIASTSTTTICTGTAVTFTAAPTNGGTPSYQWRKNTAAISGATSATYSTSVISNGDVFDVVMTSTANCRSVNAATSNQITMAVNASVTPGVLIGASATTVCAGTAVTFTATQTNGGTPTYQWLNNGSNISGATTSTYTTSSSVNNDKISVVMTSTATCRTTNTATSSQITMVVNASVTPGVSAIANATTICAGTSVTFSATPTNGGTPTYQWRKNGSDISGATGATYITSSIANNDQFSVVMTSTATCRTSNTATSASVTMNVSSSLTASVNIVVSPTSNAYAGQTLTFTATPTNGGTAPTYQWRNGINEISGATNATFSSSTLTNGTSISVIMTSNAGCVTAPTVNSSSITITVSPYPTFDTSITGPTNVTANQTNVTYSVTDQPGMTYVWTVPAGATIVSGQNTNSIVVNFGSSSGSVTVKETNPASQTSTITTTVVVGPATPVTLPSTETVVSVYPIPCNGTITIDMNTSVTTNVSYMLIDATGNVVRRGIIEYSGAAVQIETDVAAGVYQLMLQWDDKSAMNRIVKY